MLSAIGGGEGDNGDADGGGEGDANGGGDGKADGGGEGKADGGGSGEADGGGEGHADGGGDGTKKRKSADATGAATDGATSTDTKPSSKTKRSADEWREVHAKLIDWATQEILGGKGGSGNV